LLAIDRCFQYGSWRVAQSFFQRSKATSGCTICCFRCPALTTDVSFVVIVTYGPTEPSFAVLILEFDYHYVLSCKVVDVMKSRLRFSPTAWAQLPSDRPKQTAIIGQQWDLGMVSMAVTLPIGLVISGWIGIGMPARFLLMAMCLLCAAGFRFGVNVNEQGVQFERRWFGLVWLQRRYSLNCLLTIQDSGDDFQRPEAVVLNEPTGNHPASRFGCAENCQAIHTHLQHAIQQAQGQT
jgi:Pyruvate/2-oxoacid:ferredoxin oxidoreductase delta subunit